MKSSAGLRSFGIFNSYFLFLSFIFCICLFLSHSSKGQSTDTIQNQSTINDTTLSNSAPKITPQDSSRILSEPAVQSLIKQIQAAASDEFDRSVEKFESRKIYLRQHDLITSLKDENYRIKRILTKGFDYNGAKNQISEFQSLTSGILKGMIESDVELLTERNLTVSSAIFREMLDQISVRKEEVDNFADQIRQSQYIIDSISAEKDLYLFSDDSLETRQYAFLLLEIARETNPIDDSLKAISNRIDSLQTTMNEMVFDLNTQIENIGFIRKRVNASIFTREIPKNPDAYFFKRSLAEVLAYSIFKEKLALSFYFNLYPVRFFLMSLLVLLAWIFLQNITAR